MQPTVSVLINNFNKAKYLDKCLNSVARQTYQDFEVIFWDDNSTDDSMTIFRDWRTDLTAEDKYSRYRCYSTSWSVNICCEGTMPGVLPLGVTRYFAMQRCRGRYIALLDADDFWVADKLEKQIPLFKTDTGLVFSDCYFFDGQNMTGRYHENYPVPTHKHSFYSTMLNSRNFIPACTAVFDKRKLLSVLEAPSHYTSGEDYDWWLRLLAKFGCEYIEEPLACYRCVVDSLNHDPRTSTRSTWYEIDAAVNAYRRLPAGRYDFKMHLAWLYCKLIWKQFKREKLR
jgi:glycosyltransferase involved in cell wall biosynthesis